MAIIDLLLSLVTGNPDLLGIENHHVVTDIQMTAEHWFMLAHKQPSYLGSQPAQNSIFGINNVPLPANLRRLDTIGFHHISSNGTG